MNTILSISKYPHISFEIATKDTIPVDAFVDGYCNGAHINLKHEDEKLR